MECPKCQTENPETRKFCRECGSKLILLCPQCSSENLPGDKFCGECGHNLSLPSELAPKELSFEEKIDKIQRYLPKGLTEKILSQRDKIEGERKQVTVMFCDMQGFTRLSERLGPEEAYDIVDQIYELLIHKVHDYEGTVNEMTGDGIVALFGAPIALEDAPQRALRSAMAIHREMSRFSDKLKQGKDYIPLFRMRIGIHTGPVVVGTVGNNLRVEFKAVGDTVNLASRMEGLAEPGSTYVTEDTFKLTEGYFRFEALGEKNIKGKEEPINVYRVIAPSTSRTRFDVTAERGLTPFVGRDRELELMLDAFDRSKAGRGQAFSIVGEAGVGKSRLLYEFRKTVANEELTFLEGKCLSYGRNIPYHPVIDILKSSFFIQDDDSDSLIRKKIKSGLKTLGTDEASSLPYLLDVMSVKESGMDQFPISPEERKDRIIEAIKLNILKGSEIRPMIIAIEDLHWIDKSSEVVLKEQLESVSGARILLIFTYRPEYVPTWGGKSYHNQVNLNRLSNRESLLMVNYLLGSDDLDRSIEELILEKTEGIPFFIEEFIRSLKDLRIIEREDGEYRLVKDVQGVTIPSTIQDVIMSRVDSLPESAKELLQIGSVIEREFDHELLRKVSGLTEADLLSNLSVLKDAELLYERGIYPESSYTFKHALTREVVYDSILSKRRKKLHEEIGNSIEELYEGSLDDYYGILAERFIESENFTKGAHYSKMAARKALKAGFFVDAIEHSEGRIFCIESLPVTDDNQRQLIDARTLLAGCCAALSLFAQAKEAVMPIVDLAVTLNYEKRLPAINTTLGIYSIYVEEDFSKAFQYLKDVLEIAAKVGDYVSLGFTCYYLGVSLSLNCEFEDGLGHFKKLHDLSALANNPVAISNTQSSQSAFNYVFQGKIDLAYQTSEESLKLAEETDDVYAKGMACSSYGISSYCRGDFHQAENYLLKGFNFCEKTGLPTWMAYSAIWLGHIYMELEKHERAQDYYQKAMSIFEGNILLPTWVNFCKLCMARATVLHDDQSIDLNALVKYCENYKFKVFGGWMSRYMSEILLNVDAHHVPEAENWIKKAIEFDDENGTDWFLAQDHAVYAGLLRQKGDHSNAQEKLTKAIEIFEKCGADGWVKKYEEEMAALS